jgi:hypothetical protein
MTIAELSDEQFIRWRKRYERKQRAFEREHNHRGIFPPGYISFLNNVSNRTDMKVFQLIRRSKVGNAVTGQIYLRRWVGDGVQFNSLENAAYIIPAGTYEARITYSPKFGKKLPLLIGVPGRDGIRIHTGNKPEHSLGCILVGAAGKKLIEELIRINNSFNEKTSIEIIDAYGTEGAGVFQPVGQEARSWHPQLALPAHFCDHVHGDRDLPE